MTKPAIVLQDVFLNLIRKDRIPLSIVLTNNEQLNGFVKGFDSFTIILENEEGQFLIYKNAVAILKPSRVVLM
ncbi:MAG: RNA chaperone Hfq [Christensenellales bacterium]|jgi:host factor-I protein